MGSADSGRLGWRAVLLAVLLPVVLVMGMVAVNAAQRPRVPPIGVHLDVDYVGDGLPAHRFDLYVPRWPEASPVVVFIHGGAWRFGDKGIVETVPSFRIWRDLLLRNGFAVASVNYRMVPDAVFPAQVYDVKAAIRYLNANGRKLGIDPTRIAVAGDSAGGHLALMMGTSVGDPDMEGDVGLPGVASGVRAVVSYYGVTDFIRFWDDRRAAHCGLGKTGGESSEGQLIGGIDPADPANVDVAATVSPVSRASRRSLPSFLLHGTIDCVVGVGQSVRMHEALTQFGVESHLRLIRAGHSAADFWERPELQYPMVRFLVKQLRGVG